MFCQSLPSDKFPAIPCAKIKKVPFQNMGEARKIGQIRQIMGEIYKTKKVFPPRGEKEVDMGRSTEITGLKGRERLAEALREQS